ncbi:type III secretion system effector protein, partial [Xanthomonas hortorum pv. carotae]|nr:type III secretion system effector protein [Xanthomonas hortorum pv. carotae]
MKPSVSAAPLNRSASTSSPNSHEIEQEAIPDASRRHSDAQPDGALIMLSRRPSKRGKETADATALTFETASHLDAVDPQVSQPVVSSNPGKASLASLKEKLAADNRRPVQPQL